MKVKEHLSAVALKYSPDIEAPFITIKEKDKLAEKMIQIAKENNIPVVEDEILTNVLSIQQIGECIPENTWTAVAQIFAYIRDVEKFNDKNVFKD